MLLVLSSTCLIECLSKKDEILYVYPGFIRHCLPFLNPKYGNKLTRFSLDILA